MTKEEAARLVISLFKAYNVAHAGLNEKGFAGGMFGAAELFFSYQEDGVLNCLALIYRFRREPKANVISLLEKASKNYDTGGGELEYTNENRGLFLKRFYTETIPETEFINDMKRLLEASLFWANEVIERVASEAFQHKD